MSDDGQAILSRRDSYIKILNSLPDDDIRTQLGEEWEKNSNVSGLTRWRALKEATSAENKATKKGKRYGLQLCLLKIVLLYPSFREMLGFVLCSFM